MPFTFREYPVREIALAIKDNKDLASGHERTQAGDIIVCRKPLLAIGRAEAALFLWLHVEGPDTDVLDRLIDSIEEGEDALLNVVLFEKRRFCIPLARLPSVDLARVTDPSDIYQPFLPIDEDTFFYLEGTQRRPLRLEGIIFDKLTGQFL